jgi:hypothetical protein
MSLYSTNIYMFEPEYKAYLAKATALGYTLPSFSESKITNRLIKRLKQGGLYSRMKTGNIYFYGDINTSTINIPNPNAFQHIPISTPSYTQKKGVRASALGQYINTKYRTNEYAGIESDLTTVIFVNENSSALSSTMYGARILSSSANTRLEITSTAVSGTTGSTFGYDLNANNFSNTNNKGLYIQTQDTGKTIIYKNGQKTETSVTIVTPDINNDVLLLAANSNLTNGGLTRSGQFNLPVSCLFRFDKFTDADELAFRNIWTQFLDESYPTTNTWYVRPSGGSYGSENGTSYVNAWDGIANINWASIGHNDTLYICGTHTEQFEIKGSFMTVRGDYSGDEVFIDSTGIGVGVNVRGQSYLHIIGITVANSTVSCMQLRDDCNEIIVEDCVAYNSGNQGYQNENRTKAHYINCVGYGCVDDGFSLHSTVDIIMDNCEFYSNAQGINGIATAKLVANNCYIHDNTENIRPDSNSDFTANACTFENGSVFGNSTVPLKLNGCTFISAPITGNTIVT